MSDAAVLQAQDLARFYEIKGGLFSKGGTVRVEVDGEADKLSFAYIEPAPKKRPNKRKGGDTAGPDSPDEDGGKVPELVE